MTWIILAIVVFEIIILAISYGICDDLATVYDWGERRPGVVDTVMVALMINVGMVLAVILVPVVGVINLVHKGLYFFRKHLIG